MHRMRLGVKTSIKKYVNFKYIFFGILIFIAFVKSFIPTIKHTYAWININNFKTDTLIDIKENVISGKGGASLIIDGKLKSRSIVQLRYRTSDVTERQAINNYSTNYKFLPIWYLTPKYMIPKCTFMSVDGEIINHIPLSHFIGRILKSLIFSLPLLISLVIYNRFIKDL